jgi:hypothetical protein
MLGTGGTARLALDVLCKAGVQQVSTRDSKARLLWSGISMYPMGSRSGRYTYGSCRVLYGLALWRASPDCSLSLPSRRTSCCSVCSPAPRGSAACSRPTPRSRSSRRRWTPASTTTSTWCQVRHYRKPRERAEQAHSSLGRARRDRRLWGSVLCDGRVMASALRRLASPSCGLAPNGCCLEKQPDPARGPLTGRRGGGS